MTKRKERLEETLKSSQAENMGKTITNNALNTNIFDSNRVNENELTQIWRSLLVSKDTAEKMIDDISTYREIFLNYCGFGEKINYNKLSYTGYVKFLRDCDLIYDPVIDHEKDRIASIVRQKTKSIKNNRSMAGTNRSKTNKFGKSTMRSISSNHKTGAGKGGRMLESECNILFQNLTGVKNFDKDGEKVFSYTDKRFNKMYVSTRVPKIGSKSFFEASKETMYGRMDFKLFIKSFETLATKLYGHKDLDRALKTLLDYVKNTYLTHINRISQSLYA